MLRAGRPGRLQRAPVPHLTVNKPAPTTKNFFLSSLRRAGGMCGDDDRVHVCHPSGGEKMAAALVSGSSGWRAHHPGPTCLFQSMSVLSAIVPPAARHHWLRCWVCQERERCTRRGEADV